MPTSASFNKPAPSLPAACLVEHLKTIPIVRTVLSAKEWGGWNSSKHGRTDMWHPLHLARQTHRSRKSSLAPAPLSRLRERMVHVPGHLAASTSRSCSLIFEGHGGCTVVRRRREMARRLPGCSTRRGGTPSDTTRRHPSTPRASHQSDELAFLGTGANRLPVLVRVNLEQWMEAWLGQRLASLTSRQPARCASCGCTPQPVRHTPSSRFFAAGFV